MVLVLDNEDIIGLISSYLPYNEIINNLRGINEIWKNSINKSHYCWKNVDLTETFNELGSDNENILIEEIKRYNNIVTSIRLCNPKNNITGFLSQLIIKNDINEYIKWNHLSNIEIYNKSLIIPFKNNEKNKLLPFKSLFRLGINENIMQLLKTYEIEDNKIHSFENECSIYSNIISNCPFSSLRRIIIDYPISTKELNILSNCFPCLKDIIITRLFHEKSELESENYYEDEMSSCWDALYNFLQIIPPNQLRIIQFNIIPCPNPLSGEWNIDNTISKVFTENSNMNNNEYSEELYKTIKRNNHEYICNRNKIMRANEYYNGNNLSIHTSVDSNLMSSFDEKGDKLMKYILDMHSESLVALSCSDLEVSYSLYKRLVNYCPKLKLWNLPGWRIFI